MKIVILFYLFMSLKIIIKSTLLSLLVLIMLLIITKKCSAAIDQERNVENQLVKYYSKLENKTNNIVLDDFLVVNEQKDTLNISQLVDSEKLIYRFSELHCDVCVINEFKNLKESLTQKELQNVVILSSYNNLRNLYIFKRINSLKNFEVYNVVNNVIGNFEIEELGYPYFFCLNRNLIINNSFIPNKNDDQRTINYLNKIFKRSKQN